LTGFGVGFWKDALRERGYAVIEERLDLETLAKQRVVPSSHLAKGRDSPSLMEAILLYRDRYVEAAALVYDRLPSRGVCVKVARQWRENRLYRPLLIFTDGESCYAVIVRGAGLDGEARVLHLEDRLYRTDMEVLESIKHPGTPEELQKKYDEEFFPYEKVRNEFFNRYRELYEKVVSATKRVLGEKRAKEYAQRFLGRLMFIYFLQRKGWLNNDKNYIDKIKDYMALNDLFYNKLNKEDGDGIPYLNGSLFEREDYIGELETKAGHKLDEIFKEARKLFNNYNFTVDETSPLEVEVSVDPLLLGTVLENMLPEHERGAKGTFYTPVNEIGFICRKALAAWLGVEDRVEKDRLVDGLQEYIEGLKRRRDEREIREFREKLLSVKVCDPAVGSGGFLVVMMQTIISLIQEVEEAVGWRADPAIYKARILSNLYGFDIEPEAVEIARLRLWLSLIIDQKKPEPLPNLDMNLIVIDDSLLLPDTQQSIDDEVQSLHVEFSELRRRYLNEHNMEIKNVLRQRLQKLGEEISKRIGIGPNVIETYMQHKADIVIMNPPYVRQESIPNKKKNYYSETYGIDKKSDLYAYFLIRALTLVSDSGVVSAISSDKWLETEYGVSVQKKLKDYLVVVYGQRKRSFGADINTVITVLKKKGVASEVHFIYLESYSNNEVRQHIKFERSELKPGKWFYLRPGAKFFIEKLLPMLTRKLGDFAEIKFGIKTGANEFFMMKNCSHLYETDYLANPKKFEDWGVKAKNSADLEKEGLIYIENEGGQRFVIDKKDVVPIIRRPKEVESYVIKKVSSLVFRPHPIYNPGRYSKQYIKWGESVTVEVKKGTNKGRKVQGYNNLRSVKQHKPFWYSVSNLNPATIVSFKFINERHFVPICPDGVLADHTCDLIYPKRELEKKLWLYMNSSLFFLTKELYGLRMGGGVLQVLTEEFKQIPVADITTLNLTHDSIAALQRKPLPIFSELEQQDRKDFDLTVLRMLRFRNPDTLLYELLSALKEVVEDRLVKADVSKKGGKK
jgi:type II restriction/modification system DNA methylase subunit YeeA